MIDIKKAEETILKKSEEPKDLPNVKGYNFDEGINFDKIIDSYSTTGYQATNLVKAIKIINKMIEDKCTIYLGYTSNMVSSGLRDIFRYLAKHKMIDVIVTTGGGIEEDIIKCFDNFYIGSFEADGVKLREKGINRIGNIFVPNERYCKYEDFLLPIINKINKEITPSELIDILGKKINDERSIYYWTHKNKIPVFSCAILDGSTGDMSYFNNYNNPNFKIELIGDIRKLNDITITAKKTGMIILGSGVMKHTICNTNLMRNGADYAVYINTAPEYDGSDSGAKPDEAKSWGKIKAKAEDVKVFGDATILFPLIVAKTFARKAI